MWDLETGQQVGKPLIGHESCVTGALLLPCGTLALSWSLDKTLRLFGEDALNSSVIAIRP
jgi:WD40 repeat protein